MLRSSSPNFSISIQCLSRFFHHDNNTNHATSLSSYRWNHFQYPADTSNTMLLSSHKNIAANADMQTQTNVQANSSLPTFDLVRSCTKAPTVTRRDNNINRFKTPLMNLVTISGMTALMRQQYARY